MAVEMKKTYQAYADNPPISFLLHSIVPEHDTQEKLKQYAEHQMWMVISGFL